MSLSSTKRVVSKGALEKSSWDWGETERKGQGVPRGASCRNPEKKRWWTKSGTTGLGEKGLGLRDP